MRARIYDRNADDGAPRKAPVILGESLDMGPDGTLLISDARGEKALAKYSRARVLFISAHGLLIEAFEERAGNRFIRRELWANTEKA